MDVLNFCPGTIGVPFGSLVRKHPEYSVAKSPEILRGPSIMLMSRFAPELNRKKPGHALNDCIHLFKRARVEQLPGCRRIMFHIVGCKIRNARNVLIVDSFVFIVRGPETDSRSKSYGRLKFLPRHQRGYPLVAWSESIRKIPLRNLQKIYVDPL